jgi:hypothetical protein
MMDPKETTVTTTTTTRTTETPISPQIPPLDDGSHSVPAWANKVVDEIAEAGREPKTRQKVIAVLRLAAVLFAFVGLTFFLILTVYWLGQPYGKPVVEFDDGINILRSDGTPGPVVVEAGSEVLVQSSYCKNHDTISTIIRREFHDDLVFHLPDTMTNAPKGCGTRFSTPLKIPSNLPPDTYTLYFTFVYQINPLRSVNYTFETNEFTVVAKT